MKQDISRRDALGYMAKASAWALGAGGIFVPKIVCAQMTLPHRRAAFRRGGGAGYSLIENDATTASTSFGAGNYYWGQAAWQRPSAITIYRLEFELLGNGSSRNWTVGAWTMTGINLNLAGLQRSSNLTAGANWTSATWFGADFTSGWAPSAATNYALLLWPETALGGNDIASYLDGTGLSGGGNRETFSAAGAASFAGGNDVSIRIYYL